MLPQSFLDDLIARNDIVDVVGSYVALQQKGSNLFGLCPFHNEKTPSFSVSPSKQIYHCFGCKKGGGVINFIMEIENLSYMDAVRFLAKRVNLEVPDDRQDDDAARRRQRILALNRDAARWYYDVLQSPEGAAVQAYLDRRQIRRGVAVRFGMGASTPNWDDLTRAMTAKGYTKTELITAGLAVASKKGSVYDKFRNRLMLPVIDQRGDVVGFGSRVIDNSEPKYMNTTDTPVYSKRHVLYGLNLAKKTKRPEIILCEGNLDVVTLHQAGFDNAVASMGTALTQEQIRLLSRYTKNLVLCYDNDSAGQMATQRALEMLNNTEFTVRVLRLPNKMVDGQPKKQDADDFIKAYGPDAFAQLLNGSAGGMEFRMAQVAGKYDMKDDRQRVAYAQEISQVLCTLENAVEREVYTNRAAEVSGFSKEAMRTEVERAARQRRSRDRKQRERRELNPAVSLQPTERSIRYTNLRSAMAEEGVIRLLLHDDTVFPQDAPLQEEDFSSPLLGKIFGLLWQHRSSAYPMAALSASLSGEEMSHLTALIQKPESTANAEKSLQDYLRIIREEKMKRADSGADPLVLALEKKRNSQKKTEDT
ncbi:MAG: DNA primase [Oscillospiraceae bacterium]|nr:DNA primase [Oscillospiraceae bacterium]MBR0211015.1 DNA primase [Oscillospiraceae bacterium]